MGSILPELQFLSSPDHHNLDDTARGRVSRLLLSIWRRYRVLMDTSGHEITESRLHALYPDLDEEQRRQAKLVLDRYLAILLRIHDRITSDPAELVRFRGLTETIMRSTMPSGPLQDGPPIKY